MPAEGRCPEDDLWNPSAIKAFVCMGFLRNVRDETDDEGEIEAEKRSLRELLTTFRVKSQIELPGLADNWEAQNAIGNLIAQSVLRRRDN
jgi:hypothetical protein